MPRVRTTAVLVALNALIFIVMSITAPAGERLEFSERHLIAFGGLTARHFDSGEIWRAVTSAFVHASLGHVVWNMAALLFLGYTLEARFGAARFVAVYVASGLFASLLTLQFLRGTDIVAIVASGAVSGLIGAGVLIAMRLGRRARYLRNSLAGWAALVLVNGFLYQTNNVAHGSGLLAGGLVALLAVHPERLLTPNVTTGIEQLLGIDRVSCARCGADNPGSSAFCGTCGGSVRSSEATS